MRENRTVNTIVNFIFGLVNKLINIIMPFFTRTIIIYVLGMEYVGLNGLFTSILQVLNLAELGISSAIVYCMYKPVADNDRELIGALLKYIKKLYHIIGGVVFLLGIMLVPFLDLFIKGSVPNDINIYILYSIYLINTGIGYFFFAYKSSLLIAGQKIGITSNVNTIIVLLQGIGQIIAISVFKNYYLFLGMMPVFTIINNILILLVTNKYYPDIRCEGTLDSKIKKDIATKIKGLFVTRICNTTRNAFDSIFISVFIGLTTVAIYGNYYYIMSAVIGILSVVTTSMTASVGNSLVTESVEKNYEDFRKFNFIFNWIVGFCTCCLLTMYQPFMKLWMGENALFPMNVVILFCIYFYALNMGSIRAVYHDAAGLWWEARFRAIIEAILNIILNFLLTKRLGVFGTILGTLISLIIVNYGWGAQIVFKYYFKKISSLHYFVENAFYGLITVLGCGVSYFLTTRISISGSIAVVFCFVVSLFIFNGIYILIVFRTQLFKQSVMLGTSIIRNIFHKILNIPV